MIDTRYKKLTGQHAGDIYVVVAPYSEIERPLRWMLHMEKNDEEKCIAAEEELADPKLWEPQS
jgi:hypothetical protein